MHARPLNDPDAVSDHDLTLVLATLYRHRGASTALEVAKRSYLSSIVVIPALAALMEQELVARKAEEHGPLDRPTWSYVLTAKGRRSYQSMI